MPLIHIFVTFTPRYHQLLPCQAFYRLKSGAVAAGQVLGRSAGRQLGLTGVLCHEARLGDLSIPVVVYDSILFYLNTLRGECVQCGKMPIR